MIRNGVSDEAVDAYQAAWERENVSRGHSGPRGTRTRAGLEAALPVLLRDNAPRPTHTLEWSEARRDWWVTTRDADGQAIAGRPLSYFLAEGNEPDAPQGGN